jgi:hypothetical protein
VRTRSIDREGADRGLAVDGGGGSKSGDDGGFRTTMLGHEDKGKKFVRGRKGNGGGDQQLLKAVATAWGWGGVAHTLVRGGRGPVAPDRGQATTC